MVQAKKKVNPVRKFDIREKPFYIKAFAISSFENETRLFSIF